ncbi:MAG TPA: ABC transporter ATP-binding protein [Chitinophagaceae bacterium]|nr:ABC transporter ATP-binding protein [Chitinophagaceae bacterium]
MTAIQVENLSKQYRLGQVGRRTLRHDFNRWLHKLAGKEDPYVKIGDVNNRTIKSNTEYVWALRDINFSAEQGSVTGIIGSNGAGKSTLLKILSKVTSPTTGSVKIKGRIASLLEVGTGFHPDLSGRDNVFLNGAILGMTKKEIAKKFDDIVAFSGVEKYIDTPVKRYSSGMYVRLAFAVAAHLEPDILIVDEVLAVGDAEFQKKCLGKMKDVSQREGRTVLFVSHNMDAISKLCESCIYLKNGYIHSIGATDTVIDKYIHEEIAAVSNVVFTENHPGSNAVRLLSAKVIDAVHNNKINFGIDEKIGINMEFEVLQATNDLVCGFNLYNNYDLHLLSSHDTLHKGKNFAPGIYSATVWLPGNLLTEGMHYCGLAAMSYKPFTIHFHAVNAIGFNIQETFTGDTARGSYHRNIPGVVRPKLEWSEIIQL